MTDYKKPVVVGCDDVAEGVYLCSEWLLYSHN